MWDRLLRDCSATARRRREINADRLEIHAGGVTGNNLTQVARLGASAGWLGLIGDDESGRLITKAFADDGLDLSGAETIKGEQSTFTWIPVDAQGERCIYMFPNINGKLSVEQVRGRFAPNIKSAKHFIPRLRSSLLTH